MLESIFKAKVYSKFALNILHFAFYILRWLGDRDVPLP